jgi:uncharacterized protein (TIGR02246 family)
MMDGRLTPVLASVALLAVACQPADRQQVAGEAAVDTAEVEAVLDSLRSAFLDAYEAGDAERIASLWAEDGVTAAPSAPPVRGRDSIRAMVDRDPALGKATAEISPLDVQVIDRDWAYEMGTLSVQFTPEGADQEQTVEISYLAVIHRTPDGWKYYREAYNLNQPPAESP